MKKLLSMGLAALTVAWAPASAQDYPSRPLTLVVSFSPGGPNDILGRIVAGALSEQIGQPVNVENIPGRSGNNGTEAVVGAEPDGYTLLLVGPANAINVSLYDDLAYNFQRDIAPVAPITREPLVLVVHPDVQARTVPELLDLARASPEDLTVASTGNGSSPHVTAVLFMTATGIDLPMEHFQGGGPALEDIIAGNTRMMFEPMSAAIGPVRSGELRALAVTTQTPSEALAGIPTVAETVPGFEASAVTGIGVPAGTPAEIVEKLNAEINAALSDPEVMAELAATGGEHLTGSASDFADLLAGEIVKWGDVIKAAGITAQ